MNHVYATRIHVRSVRHLLPFFYYLLQDVIQLKRSPGFQRGTVFIDKNKTYWTQTSWESNEAMLAFRNSGWHRKSMPKIQLWCDEGVAIGWQTQSNKLQSWPRIREMMLKEGHFIKLTHANKHQHNRIIREPRTQTKLNALPL